MTLTSYLRKFIHAGVATLLSLFVFQAYATTALAQAYNQGVYGGGPYGGSNQTVAPTASPTPLPSASVTPSSSPAATPVETTVSPLPSPTPTRIVPVSHQTPESANSGLAATMAQIPAAIWSALEKLAATLNGDHALGQSAQILASMADAQPAIIAAAPVAAIGVSVAPMVAPMAQTIPFLQWQHIIGAIGLVFRRRRHPWGVVFDARTKEPLDPVLLTLTDANGKQTQAISDMYGRYEFLVEPGQYRLQAQKTHYRFPSENLGHAQQDEVYDDLYYGEPITITAAAPVMFNIPMDPLELDWNQQEKGRMGILGKRRLWAIVGQALFWGGLVWSLVIFSVEPGLLTGSILVIYSLCLALQVVVRRRHRSGTIRNSVRQPVEGAIVRVSDIDSPVAKYPPVVTKQSGQYAFLVEQGTYKVSVEQKTASGYQVVATSDPITIHSKYGDIHHNLQIQ
jgi:hypothetical protein